MSRITIELDVLAESDTTLLKAKRTVADEAEMDEACRSRVNIVVESNVV